MLTYFNRIATPLTLGLFAISAISGIALFLHVGQSAFHEMHEWLSMVLLLPFVLHVWRNWAPLASYVRRGTLFGPVLASLVAAAAFAWPAISGGETRPSPQLPVQLMTRASLADLAPVLKTTPDALQGALRARGYKVSSTLDSIDTIAGASGTEPRKALFEVLPKR